MNPQSISLALKLGIKAKRLATSGEERVKLFNNVKLLLLLPLCAALIILFFTVILITAITGSLNGGNVAGFRSGAPTAFAVADIPAEYIPIFLKAQSKYNVSWAVLAAIAKVESSFGIDMGPSSAGAIGFMQFMPDTWNKYKQDGNGDGEFDPYNPWDAVFAAAHMLQANGFANNPEKALFTYNRAGWYVRKVMDLAANYSSTMLPVGNGLWPLPSEYINILSGFGMRFHPIKKEYRFHDGIDIPAPTGTPVFAVEDGRVDWDRAKSDYGLCVVLNHGTCQTLYAHLSEISVKTGAMVKAGEIIGFVGSTGVSTGPHLHFSVFVNGQPCNPEEWLAVPSGNY